MDPVAVSKMKNNDNPAGYAVLNKTLQIEDFTAHIFDTNDTVLVLSAAKDVFNNLDFNVTFLNNNLNVVQATKLFSKSTENEMAGKQSAKVLAWLGSLLFFGYG